MGNCAKGARRSVAITKLGIAKIEEEWRALTATNGPYLGDIAPKSPPATASLAGTSYFMPIKLTIPFLDPSFILVGGSKVR
jgi:hypothetical protein